MAKYMIHTCKDRYWYVKNYLVPQMKNCGIAETDIMIWLDRKELGCLESCMSGFSYVASYYPCETDGIWHLQDDVIVCKDFKKYTEAYDKGVVCAYCWEKDQYKHFKGEVDTKHMWYSFPCIRIPNDIAVGCGNWFYKDVIHNREYSQWIRSKKYDDSVFRIFMLDYVGGTVLNLIPNLVDHIDYLIGGSVINRIRGDIQTRAEYFEDKYLVEELRKVLEREGK